MVDLGADVDLCDKDKQTPLHLAAKHRKSVEVFKSLIESSANACDGEMLETLLELVVSHNASADVVKLLVSKGADKTAALKIAVKQKDVNVVKMLIDNGADVRRAVEKD